MKRTSKTLEEMLGPIPANVQAEVDLSFEISGTENLSFKSVAHIEDKLGITCFAMT